MTKFEDRLIDFSISVKNLIRVLPYDDFSKNLKNQLARSATSPAFNYGEAQSSESKRDFIHKMGICLKELRETRVGIKIIERCNYSISNQTIQKILGENNELIAIFSKSINTAKKNLN